MMILSTSVNNYVEREAGIAMRIGYMFSIVIYEGLYE